MAPRKESKKEMEKGMKKKADVMKNEYKLANAPRLEVHALRSEGKATSLKAERREEVKLKGGVVINTTKLSEAKLPESTAKPSEAKLLESKKDPPLSKLQQIIKEEKENTTKKYKFAEGKLTINDKLIDNANEIKEKVRVWELDSEENPIKRKGIVYCYLRKSTIKQINSIESQTMEIMKFLKNARPPLPPLLEENIHVDQISGKVSWKQRKIKNILDNMLCGDTLIVYDVSRISRDVFDLFAIASIIREKKLSMIGVMNPGLGKIDGSPMCTSMLHCLSVCASIELTNISYRTKSALAAVKASGKMICGEARVVNVVNEVTGEVEQKQVPRLGTTYRSKISDVRKEVEADVRSGEYNTKDICGRNTISSTTFYKALNKMTAEDRGAYHAVCLEIKKIRQKKMRDEKKANKEKLNLIG
jgi:DNA invertase Pin-like site-specific DNA recombinase